MLFFSGVILELRKRWTYAKRSLMRFIRLRLQ